MVKIPDEIGVQGHLKKELRHWFGDALDNFVIAWVKVDKLELKVGLEWLN